MNAAIRAVVKAAIHRHDLRVTGFLDGFAGLLADQSRALRFDDVAGIINQGGTLLGASNRDDPFRVPVTGPGERTYEDRSDAVLATLSRHQIDGLVVIGGDGSLGIARRLAAKGIAVIGIPKTIDNDVSGTDVSLGFDSAVGVATEALDRLHTTAASHHRVMVVEVMGRHAGWIALEAGLAAGGDVILIPEIPFRYETIAASILGRAERGRRFSIVVIAEGARCPDGRSVVRRIIQDSPEPVRLGGVGAVVSHALEGMLPFEVRDVVLGHVQRILRHVLGLETRDRPLALHPVQDRRALRLPSTREQHIDRPAPDLVRREAVQPLGSGSSRIRKAAATNTASVTTTPVLMPAEL